MSVFIDVQLGSSFASFGFGEIIWVKRWGPTLRLCNQLRVFLSDSFVTRQWPNEVKSCFAPMSGLLIFTFVNT